MDKSGDCYVGDRLTKIMDGITFNWDWSRNPIGTREVQDVSDLEKMCYETNLSNKEDQWICTLDDTGAFSVTRMRALIDSKYLRKDNHPTSWNKLIPSKVKIHIWRTCRDKLPTLDNLVKRGITVDTNKCILCKEEAEDVNHIFLGCKKTGVVREAINKWCNGAFDVDGSLSVGEVFYNLGSHKPKSKPDFKELLLVAYCWTISKGRNAEIFKGVPFNSYRAANDIQFYVYSWLCNRSKDHGKLDWNRWSCNPDMV
ncbi:uncharacterized protein LOC112507122 [Cynara cardunculus var. scolymus]|uniref:uncharacterized protein LOC112507122 n=1 Tax=Cynara cardunculus var. scolymus TaxID=59895 RepID=UPI000D624CF7|nr:uncharacterized protein LOC112507122 [Cynara cardunculus var. scolymus]